MSLIGGSPAVNFIIFLCSFPIKSILVFGFRIWGGWVKFARAIREFSGNCVLKLWAKVVYLLEYIITTKRKEDEVMVKYVI